MHFLISTAVAPQHYLQSELEKITNKAGFRTRNRIWYKIFECTKYWRQKKIFMLIRKMYILFPAAFTKHCAMYFSFFIAFQIVNWSKVAANKICDVKKPKISFIFPQQITILLKYIHMMTLINWRNIIKITNI